MASYIRYLKANSARHWRGYTHTDRPSLASISVIKNICDDFELDFFSMYCAVGLWNSFFIMLYSVFDVSRLMRWSTRSTEEIFALFISIAFCVDASRDTYHSEWRRSRGREPHTTSW